MRAWLCNEYSQCQAINSGTFEINDAFTTGTVVVPFVLEDVGIYVIILLRNKSVFLSLVEICGNFLSDSTQNWLCPQRHHQLWQGFLLFL